MEKFQNCGFPKEEQECGLKIEYENGDRSTSTPVYSPGSSPGSIDESFKPTPKSISFPCLRTHPEIRKIVRDEGAFSHPTPTSLYGGIGFHQDKDTPTSPSRFCATTAEFITSQNFGQPNVRYGTRRRSFNHEKQSLCGQEQRLNLEIESLRKDNEKIYEDGESLVRSTQAVQQYIRNILMTSRLLNEDEEAIQEILGQKEGEVLKSGKRRKTSTCQEVETWSLRFLHLKGERTDLAIEQTKIYQEIDRNLDLIDELNQRKQVMEQNFLSQKYVVVNRSYSDGVLFVKRETECLKGRVKEELRESTYEYIMKKISRRGNALRSEYSKVLHETAAEFYRMRTFMITRMKKLGKLEKKMGSFRGVSYEEFQMQILKVVGTYDYLIDSREVEKKGFIFWRRKGVFLENPKEEEEIIVDNRSRSSVWKMLFGCSPIYHFKKVYMNVSMIYGTVSIYMSDFQRHKEEEEEVGDEEPITISTQKRERKDLTTTTMKEEHLLGRWALQDCVIEIDQYNGVFKLTFKTESGGNRLHKKDNKKVLVGKGMTWRETKGWFSFFSLIIKEYERLQE